MRHKDRLFPTRLVDANSGMLSLSSDGSVDWSRALRLAEFAFRDGIRQAVLMADQSCAGAVRRRMRHFTSLLAQHHLPIEVTAGIELGLQSDLFDQAVRTSTVIGGPLRRYVFLRIARDNILPIAPVVDALKRMKLVAVLLSPERCPRFRENSSELQEIVSGGGLIQFSASSLVDQTDRARIRFCRQSVRKGHCHFVASESGRHHDIPVSLKEAYLTIVGWGGTTIADTICHRNPSRLFAGEKVESTSKPQSLFRVFSRAA